MNHFDAEWEISVTKQLRPHEDKEIFVRWAKQENIKKKLNCRPCFERLLRKGGRVSEHYFSQMPFSDHVSMYERFDGTRVLISQPYCEVKDVVDSKEMKDWLNDRGLKISLLSDKLSWHNPGLTILIQIEVEDEIKCNKAIKETIKKYNQYYNSLRGWW
jgi:hypothetical protein